MSKSGQVRIDRATLVSVIAVAALIAASNPANSQDTPLRSVWDGVYSNQQAVGGRDVYNMRCSVCHGPLLSGGESAPPLTGGEFLSNWNGLTVGDLFERIRISMPLDDPGKLGRDATLDVVAYILSMNQFPSGSTDLPKLVESLKRIRIEPKK